ncbi:MAG: beta-lactamase family protein [Gammaproteobacteria bacterium]|nr:beta-lactamase family protein [Gammaproteobacteria bacterium]
MKLLRGFSRLTLVLATCLAVGHVIAEEEPIAPSTLQELRAAIAEVVEEQQVPAVSIAMVDESGPVWVGAIGKANLEKGIDADENTLFRIGSTSKMFVALSVLKLIEEGRLSLDDRLADLAPDVEFENRWEDTDPVRVVHLLEHTTGWDDIHLREYAHNDPTPATLKEGLDYHPHSRTSRWKPGSRMSYCNSGPPVAAYIVEKITGQDFEAYANANFFEPMGMETATYRLNGNMESRGATLYANGNQPQPYWHIIMRPSGSINASAADMAKFVSFYVNRGRVNGRQLISPASLRRMETPVSTSAARAGQQSGYGLNNYSSSHKQWVYREHGGGVNGGLTELAYLPEAGLGHAIMINSDNGSAFLEISRLIRDYETRPQKKKEISGKFKVSPDARAIEGLYYPINPRQQVGYFLERVMAVQKLWIEGDRLARKDLLDEDITYYFPVSNERYKSTETGLISLTKTTDPLVGTVVHANNRVLKPVSPLVVYSQLGILILWGLFIATSLIFFPVWLVRRMRGKIPPGPAIRIRLWPLLASVSVVAIVGLFMLGMNDVFVRLGSPTAFSIGIMVASLAYAVFVVMGIHTAYWHRNTAMNRGAWWHSSLASLVHVIVLFYLLYHGVIGLRTWA